MKKTLLLFLLLIPILQLSAQFQIGSSLLSVNLNLNGAYYQAIYEKPSYYNDQEIFSNNAQIGFVYRKVYTKNKLFGIGIIGSNYSSKYNTDYLVGLQLSQTRIFPIKEKYGFRFDKSLNVSLGEYTNSIVSPELKSNQMSSSAALGGGFYYFLNKNIVAGLQYNLFAISYGFRQNADVNSTRNRDRDYKNFYTRFGPFNDLSSSDFSINLQYVFQPKSIKK
jgi:hypothetical protein